MRKLLAMAVLLAFGCFKVTLGQTTDGATITPEAVATVTAATEAARAADTGVKKDVDGIYGTKTLDDQQKAYAAARAEAKTPEDFVKCAKLTPFNWVAAWCYLNAAEKAFDANDKDSSAGYVKTARKYEAKVAVAFPAKGPNSQKKFDKVASKLEKTLSAAEQDQTESGTD